MIMAGLWCHWIPNLVFFNFFMCKEISSYSGQKVLIVHRKNLGCPQLFLHVQILDYCIKEQILFLELKKIRHPVDAYQAYQNSRQKQNQYSGINKETGIEDKTVLEEEVGKTFFSPSSQDFVVSKENDKIEWQENDNMNMW